MENKIHSTWLILACFFVVFPLMAFASSSQEVYVVTTDIYGNSNYSMSHGDGTFTLQENLIIFDDVKRSYGNGIGDFDNDGDFDLILARGRNRGDIYIFEKSGSGNQFVQRDPTISWDGGLYPTDMAVADFNEDGELDFILTYYLSNNCSLYEGDGNFGFVKTSLAETAPSVSLGADAADFNNDGHADFVVVPYFSSDAFYINLGNGDGTFMTLKNEIPGANGYWGVAAADFNRDGNADFVATYNGLIDIYYGNGDGSFEYQGSILDSGIYNSPADNYDFDGDGNQDIVIGRYTGDAPYSYEERIAVFFGDGAGSFGDPVVYGGSDTRGYVTAISAPPSVANKEPVAVIYCDLFEETVAQAIPEVSLAAGQTFTVDGLDSYDEDGEITDYRWDFGDGRVAQGDTVQHVYDEVGQYTITLTVTDNRDATNSAELTLLVVPRETIEAKIKFLPRVLNLKSRGRWIWAFAKLPKGYQANQVAVNSLVMNEGNSEHTINFSDNKEGVVVNVPRRHAGTGVFKLKIDRQLVADALEGTSDRIVLGIQGQVLHNDEMIDFFATDTIRVIQPGKKNPRWPRCPDGGDDDGDDDDDDDDDLRERRYKYKYRHEHR